MSENRVKTVRSRVTPAGSPREFTTAVLLACKGGGTNTRTGALTMVAGMPLLVRAMLTLQRAGVERIIILIDDEDQACRQTVRKYPAVAGSVHWEPVSQFRPDDVRSWGTLADEVSSFVVIDARLVFSSDLIDSIRREASPDDMLAISCQPQVPEADATERDGSAQVHALAIPADLLGSRQSGGRTITSAIGSDPSRPTGQNTKIRGGDTVATVLYRLFAVGKAAGAVRFIQFDREQPYLIRTQADVPEAERRLLRSLKTDFEGTVDTYVNRPLSRQFSRLFLRSGVSPNAITIISMSIGLLAAGMIAQGTYVSGVLGALLFQLSAVVDCSDGEVARITFTESRFGAMLDLIGDNLTHLAIFAGVAWSVYLQGPVLAWMSPAVPLVLGTAAMLANGLSLWLVMRAKRLRDAGQLGSVERTARVDVILKKVASRDFSVVLIVFAMFGWLEPFLWLAAIGSNVFWLTLGWITRPTVLTASPSIPVPVAHPVREPRA
jgi:1L-myo-inositol 1-phosphate cytidylyltransferase / CDP-L-myo-inositol myo-inositolphosphotransferase